MTDLGKYLRCVVTASNASGAGTPAPSNAVGPVAAAAVGGSTWDPAFKSSFMLLSAGNTVATNDGSSGGFVYEFTRSTQVKSSGKRYFEVKIDTNISFAASEFRAFIGIVDDTYAIGGGLPGVANSKGATLNFEPSMQATANTSANPLTPDPSVVILDNSILGVAYDLDTDDITGIYHNGALVPAHAVTPYPLDLGTSISGNMFIFCSAQWQAIASSFVSFTINASGPFALATLPSGYVAWDT